MINDNGLFGYFLHASVVVQGVMLFLISASIFSWATILKSTLYCKKIKEAAWQFEQIFWSGEELATIYAKVQEDHVHQGVEAIFSAGFQEFMRFRQQSGSPSIATIIDNTKRAMQVTQMRVQDRLEAALPLLAIVGSTSPYVGLFGTVWGIMQSFRALAGMQQASIAIVAPGIAEALIATALGLFAAIPAVIAYNRLLAASSGLLNRFYIFQEELVNILIRHLHHAPSS